MLGVGQLPSAGHADALVDQHQHRGQLLRAPGLRTGLLQALSENALQFTEMTACALREAVVDTGHLDHGVDQHAAPVLAFRGTGTAAGRTDEVAFEEVLQGIQRRHLAAGALHQLHSPAAP